MVGESQHRAIEREDRRKPDNGDEACRAFWIPVEILRQHRPEERQRQQPQQQAQRSCRQPLDAAWPAAVCCALGAAHSPARTRPLDPLQQHGEEQRRQCAEHDLANQGVGQRLDLAQLYQHLHEHAGAHQRQYPLTHHLRQGDDTSHEPQREHQHSGRQRGCQASRQHRREQGRRAQQQRKRRGGLRQSVAHIDYHGGSIPLRYQV